MGCRLVTPTPDATGQRKTEPNHVTERVSIDEQGSRTSFEKPDAEAKAAEAGNKADLLDTNSTLSVAPRTVTSQLSDIVDRCEEMEEEVQTKAVEVLERILRAQYQLEKLGDAAASETANHVGDIDTWFQEFLTEYTNKKDDVSMSTARDVLKTIEQELDAVTAQLDRKRLN